MRVPDTRVPRYEYKGLTKKWNGKLREAEAQQDAAGVKESKNFVVLYDSVGRIILCRMGFL